MANIKCINRTLCGVEGDLDALANYSAEAPDPIRFLSNNNNLIFEPPLGVKWGAQSCNGWSWSTVSQEDAIQQAVNAQQSCVVDPPSPNPNPDPDNPLPPGGGPNGNPGWQDPDGSQAELFPNQAQSCSVQCQDGTITSYTLPAGSLYALTQAQANYTAAGLACQVAKERRFCFTTESPLPSGCPGEAYSTTIVSMGQAPLTYSITGGSLPPGLAMSSGGVISGTIDSSALGDYTITVQVLDGLGNTRQKNFVLGVCGAVNGATLASYTVGTPYSESIVGVSSVGCGTGVQTFTLLGVLPPGLTLDPDTGIISGTPTGAATGNYSFTIRVTTIS